MITPFDSHHLLFLLNPYYQPDPIGEHLSLLRDSWIDCGAGDHSRAFVWIGKVRSSQRGTERHAHTESFLALQKQIEAGVETHVYLTDLASLWVGHLMQIAEEPPHGSDADGHVPLYYGQAKLDVELWLKMADLRSLVQTGGADLHSELTELADVHYGQRRVSLFGGIYHWPILVSERSPQAYFDPANFVDPAEGTTGLSQRCWALMQAHQGHDILSMGTDLRDHLLGRETWRKFSADVRYFLASGESIFRVHQDTSGFDFSGAVVEYAKALESDFRQRLANHAHTAQIPAG